MAVFLTKTWGFEIPAAPLQFGLEGHRAKARKLLAGGGHRVVLAGTKTPETPEADRGRLLAMLEPTTEPASSLDFALKTWDCDYHADGRFRWPHALLIRRAWRFPSKPAPRWLSRFHMDAAQTIVPLTDVEAAEVLALEAEEVPVLASARTRARIGGDESARRRGAPPPATTRRGVMHVRREPAYTYAMAIQGARQNAYKIGWAFDYKARAKEFNQAAMPELGGLCYVPEQHYLWDTARDAFSMEQALLRRFDARRHPQNREIVTGASRDEMLSAWIEALRATQRRGH